MPSAAISGRDPTYWGWPNTARAHRYAGSADLVHRITVDNSLLYLVEGTSTIPLAPVWVSLLQAVAAYLRADDIVYMEDSFSSSTPFLSDYMVSHVAKARPITATVTPTAPVTSRQIVRQLHNEVELTWEQLSHMLGVSRRAVHLWANGSHISSPNHDRLNKLKSMLIDQQPNFSPDERRQALFARGPSGRSRYDELCSPYSSSPADISGTVWTAEEQLAALRGSGDT